jgi:hypothetical protein
MARTLPAFALAAVSAACVLFAMSTAPTADPTGIAAGEAATLALPAWITAGLALLAAAILLLGGSDTSIAHRAGGILGMSAAIGAVAGSLLNVIGNANDNIWWAVDPPAIRTAADVLLVVALAALGVVAAEQLRPGWRPARPTG